MTDTDNPWQLRGACRGADPNLFFRPEGERGNPRRQRAAAALAICASCDVMLTCRETALAAREPYGVWGGLTENDRENIWAGRPPKTKTAPAPAQKPTRAPRLVTTKPAGGRRKPPVRRLAPEVVQLVRLLHRRGISQRRIAYLCEISRPTVQRIIGTEPRSAGDEQVAS